MIQKYEILKLNKGTTDIKNLITQNKFIENQDYRLRNVSESKKGGCTHKIEYYLHPRAFKICLIRSKNTKLYVNYYLLLEECIKYFHDYQIELNKKYIIKLKNKIVDKDDKIDQLLKKTDEQNLKIDNLLKANEKTNKMNDLRIIIKK
jgi:phage anti-repressor protein